MPDRDYAQREVTDKLGLKPGQAVRVAGVRVNAPAAAALLDRVRARIARGFIRRGRADVVLYWPRTAGEITPRLAGLRGQIAPAGGIWVITAKQGCVSASGLGYFNQDQLIPMGAAAGLVDNKVCSLSERESAMRFVIRKEDRRRLTDGGR
jgi:hypothetical protein